MKKITISGEDICRKCKHKRKEHNKNRCNHGRWGRGDYPCMCNGFEEEKKKIEKYLNKGRLK